MPKPAAFIGSSTEGLEFARAIRSLIRDDAEVTLWNEGVFTIGTTFIESLIEKKFDFKIDGMPHAGDLGQFFRVTEQGRMYLTIRAQSESANEA